MAGNRASRRTLVRWNDDLDKEVLLAVQYACAETGIRIPWHRVAEVMGQEFSEGSVVQHLAKIRQKMVESGLHVPPPMRRGMVTKQPSKIYGTPIKIESTISESVSKAKSSSTRRAARGTRKSTNKSKSKRVLTDDEDDVSEEPSLYDSDSDYGSKRKKAKRTSRARSESFEIKRGADLVKQEEHDNKISDQDDNSASEQSEQDGDDNFQDEFAPEHLSRRRTRLRKMATKPANLQDSPSGEAGSKLIQGGSSAMNTFTAGIGDQFAVPAPIPGLHTLPYGNVDFNGGNNLNWMPNSYVPMQQSPFWGMTIPQVASHGYIPPVYSNPYATASQSESFGSTRNNSSVSGRTMQVPHQFQSAMPPPSTPVLNPEQREWNYLRNISTTNQLNESEAQQEDFATGPETGLFDEQFEMGNYDRDDPEA